MTVKTSRMSSLWFFLTLLSAATSLQRVASNRGVELECRDTVEVESGESVTLNCTINYNVADEDCKGVDYLWSGTNGLIHCDLTTYICEWDPLTYVSLTISNVTKQENFTVGVSTDCGMMDPVEIQMQVHVKPSSRKVEVNPEPEPEKADAAFYVLGFLVLAGVVVLCVLFRTDRGRRIVRCGQNLPYHSSDF